MEKESMKETLLQKALGVPNKQKEKKPIVQEEVELVKAWLEDRIPTRAVSYAYGYARGKSKTTSTSANGLYRVAVVLRDLYRKGK